MKQFFLILWNIISDKKWRDGYRAGSSDYDNHGQKNITGINHYRWLNGYHHGFNDRQASNRIIKEYVRPSIKFLPN